MDADTSTSARDISNLMKLKAPRIDYNEVDAADDEKLGGIPRSVTSFRIEESQRDLDVAAKIDGIADSLPQNLRIAPTAELARQAADTLVGEIQRNTVSEDRAIEIIKGIIEARSAGDEINTGFERNSPEHNEFLQMTRHSRR